MTLPHEREECSIGKAACLRPYSLGFMYCSHTGGAQGRLVWHIMKMPYHLMQQLHLARCLGTAKAACNPRVMRGYDTSVYGCPLHAGVCKEYEHST